MIDTAKQVALGVVDALKAQPGLLLLTVFNVLFIVLVYANARDLRADVDKQTGRLADLLAMCTQR